MTSNMELKDREEQQTQEDLASLELYIRSLWEFLPLPVCYLNTKYFILQVNKRFAEFSGYSPAEIIGEDVEVLFSGQDEIKKMKKDIKERNKIEGRELTFCKKRGEKVSIEIHAEISEDPEGEFIGCFLALIDISETKHFQERLQEEVREKTKELKNKIKELEKFQELVVKREERMIELKNENKELKEKIKKVQDSSKEEK